MPYLVALDQGTTSSRAVVFDERGGVVAQHGIEFPQIYPKPGWVEHDPMRLLDTQTEALRKAVQTAGIAHEDILALGLTNQRETTLVWERETGRPVYNAIVWQCRRTAPYIEKLRDMGLNDTIRQRTGLIPDAYFSATKLAWILDQLDLRERARAGELCFGTVDTWLAWNLLSGRPHVTDVSNASRTMMLNLHTLDWDQDILDALDIPREMLPTLTDTAGIVGELDPSILGRPVPLAAMAGDQQAALFGQACFDPGMMKNTYGTGCFLLMNTGEQPAVSRNGLLSTVAWRIGGRVCYALEGSVFVAGAAIQWLRDEMGLIERAADSEALAASIPDSGGVYLVPAFTGLGAPYWDMYSRGTVVGLTRGTGKAHLVRAALEAIAYQSHDLVQAMIGDSGITPAQLRVDGGASANRFLMQFQADVLGISVVRPRVIETTALGAALMAGLAVGLYPSYESITGLWEADLQLTPCMREEDRNLALKGWHRAVDRSLGWAEG